MVALRRTSTIVAAVSLGALAAVVAIPLAAKAWQAHVARAAISDAGTLPCDKQPWFNADRACVFAVNRAKPCAV